MEKIYITKEELPQILSDLTAAFMTNARYHTYFDLGSYGSTPELQVRIIDRQRGYETVLDRNFQIIDEPKDAYDVMKIINDELEAKKEPNEKEVAA